jgi:hypothetical protein
VYPHPRVLLPGHWIKISDNFPDSLDYLKSGKTGKTYRIAKSVQVTYPLDYTIKEACYKDINLSDENAGVKLYPYAKGNMYEMLIGLHEGNYYIIPYFPSGQPVYRLDYSTMTPLVSDASLKYIGNIKPSDSPVENPVFKLYLFYKLDPIILRIVADDGVDYTKVILEFTVNRCALEEDTPPPNVIPKLIPYIEELKW